MSKRTRYADNSKRSQPTQRRAQARQPGSSGPSKSNNANQQPTRETEADKGSKR